MNNSIRTEPFEKNAKRYEGWFDKYLFAYQSELNAVKLQLPEYGSGIEIGMGTGRFAKKLGIQLGVEPSISMREIAIEKGLDVIDAVAEKLPFNDRQFDFVLMVTTICFLYDIEKALKEIHRVLKKNGELI